MISPNRVRLKTPEWLDRKRGDLVMVDYLHETGIIMGEPYVGDDGHAYVSILLTDTPAQRCESRLAPLDLPGMICKQLVQRTHLLSRPTGIDPARSPSIQDFSDDPSPGLTVGLPIHIPVTNVDEYLGAPFSKAFLRCPPHPSM